VDSATPRLFMEACCGRGKEMILELTKAGSGKGADTFMRYTLKNAIVIGYAVENIDLSRARYAEEIRPIEKLIVSFVGLELAYTPYDQNGKALAQIATGFDTATNTKA
jgi:type VI secretion system secreted protein Hcp